MQNPSVESVNKSDARAMDAIEQVASEHPQHLSNGNRKAVDSSKNGDAQHGGPDIERAQDRQPPDSDPAGPSVQPS